MIDCLLIGFNDGNFGEFSSSIHEFGERNTAWRDIRTSVVKYGGTYQRALDVFSEFVNKGTNGEKEIFHNMDFLSPAITYLGSYLQNRGFSFDYINLFQLEKEQLRQKLIKGEIRSIVVTTTLYVTPEPILEVVRFIRKYNQTVSIILGGPYILKELIDTDFEEAQRLYRYLGADFYVISSEGEQTLCNILTALKGNEDFEKISNCAYRKGNDYTVNSTHIEENYLEDTVIDYSYFPPEDLGEFVSIRTALSCPFSCAFCGFPQRAGRHRAADLNHVEKELDALHNLGHISTLTFLDDSFNVPRSRFKQLLEMMIRKRYSFKWNSFLRCDHVDAEIVDLMKEAGCEGVFIGAESGCDMMLERMNKSVRRRHFTEVIPLFKRAGIVSHMSLIVGFPGESAESVGKTVSLVEETQPDFYRAQLWYCDPMTPIWKKREHYGIKGAGFNWGHNSMTSQDAIDWVEEMFMSISGSVWLPQHGFELWSVFYLQRKGMGLEQVKQFLTCFNGVVREQILHKEMDLRTDAIRNFEAVCSFTPEPLPQAGRVQAARAEHYLKAEQCWRNMCDTIRPLSQADNHILDPTYKNNNDIRIANIDVIREAAWDFNVEERIVSLSIFTAVLSRFYGESDVSLALIWDSNHSFPVTINVSWEGSFLEHVNATAKTLNELLRYTDILPYFIESSFHDWADRTLFSTLQAGLFCENPAGDTNQIGNSWHNVPLQLVMQGDSVESFLTLRTTEQFMSSEASSDLVRYINQGLAEVRRDRFKPVAELFGSEAKTNSAADDIEDRVEFQF